jgi:hypothetical protein
LDGPFRGIQYLDRATGYLVLEDGAKRWYVYRFSDQEHVLTDFGPCPVAHFDRTTTPAPHAGDLAHGTPCALRSAWPVRWDLSVDKINLTGRVWI